MSTSRWFPMLAWLAVATAVSLAPAAKAAPAGSAAVMAYDLSITKVSNLEFGVIVPSTQAGTVQMYTFGTREVAPEGACTLLEISPIRSAAGFSIKGAPAKNFSIALPPSTITVTRTGGGGSMSVGSFESSPDSIGTLAANGKQSIAVGATLSVGAEQATGRYTGSFDVTIAYN